MIFNAAQEFILNSSVNLCATPHNNGSEIVLHDPIK